MQLFQRMAYSGLAVSLLASSPLARAQDPASPPDTLRNAAGDRMLIGAAVATYDLDNSKVADLIARQFNCLTAENDFKPDSLQREREHFTFDQADRIADFAAKHGLKMIGHNLLWHQQTPAWMFADENNQPLPRDQALANLKAHIDTVVKHFDGKVIGWDVVNEAISDNGNEYLRDTPARRAIGDDYVIQAFKLARAANPNVQLYYNDYSIEMPGKREKAIRLIKELQAAGVRVDGVGIQGHWLLHDPDPKIIDDAITAFAALDVKVMITELDVDTLPRQGHGADISSIEKHGLDPYKDALPADVQQKLADRYADLFRVFAKHRDALTRITFWGVYDGHTWLNDWPVRGRTNHPMLWDRQLHPKPALDAVLNGLQTSNATP